jgi:hypothetical protein
MHILKPAFLSRNNQHQSARSKEVRYTNPEIHPPFPLVGFMFVFRFDVNVDVQGQPTPIKPFISIYS